MFEFITDLFSSKPPALDQEAAPPPPPPAPAPQPPKPKDPGEDPNADNAKKPVDQKKMDDAANTIFKKMDGWWVSEGDKHGILDTLRGKSPDEVKAIKASYADHFPGHDMDADLGKNLEGKDLDEAKASLSGDPVTAAVTALKSAESGTLLGNVDSDRVKDILKNIPDPKQRQAVAKQVGGELTNLLEGDDKEMTQALLDDDNAKVQAYKLKESMHGGLFGGGGFLGLGVGQDKDAMYKAIEDCKDAGERQRMMDEYKTATQGQELTDDFKENLKGAETDVASKLLIGDKEGADAAKMKASTEHWFTDKDALYKTLEGKSPAERAEMVKKFNSMYDTPEKGQDAASMETLLNQNLSGLNLEKAEQLKDHGKLDDTFALKYAMEGSFWSTDKELIKKTLEGKSQEDITTLFKDKPELKQEITDGTSGRDGFEIDELMKGEPKTPQEKLERAEERYQFERGSGSNVISTGIMDLFSDKGKMLDAQEARLQELSAKVTAGEDLTDEEKQRLDKVTGYQQMDVKTYQESKDSVSNAAAGAAAIAAGAAATILTAGMAAPAVAAIAAGASGAATIITKVAIQDAGYSKEEFRNDVIMAGVNAGTGGAMGALGAEGGALFNMAGKLADSEMAKQAIIQGVSGAVSSGVGGATGAMTQGKGLGDILKAGGVGVLSGGVGGAVTGGIGGAMGNEAPEGMDTKNWLMLKGGVSGTVGAAAGNAVNPDAYKGDSAALLGNWMQAVGGGALSGVAGGIAEGKAKPEAPHVEGAPHAEGSTPVEAAPAVEGAAARALEAPVSPVEAKLPPATPEVVPTTQPVEAKTPAIPEAPPMPEVSPVEAKLPPAIPEAVPATQPVEAKTPAIPEAPPAIHEEPPPKATASAEEPAKATPIEEKAPPAVKDEALKVAKEAETAGGPSGEETKAPTEDAKTHPEEGKSAADEKETSGAGGKPPANDNATVEDGKGPGKLRAAGLDDAMSELHKTLPENSPERQSLETTPGFGVGERETQNPLVIEPGSGKEACQAQVKERMQGYEKALQSQVEAAMGNAEVKGKLLEAFGPQLRGQLTYEESLKLLGLPPEQGGVKGTELDLIAHPENGVEIAKALRERAQAAADERIANLPEEQKEEYLRRSLQQEAHARAARLTTEDVYSGMEAQKQKLTDETYKNGSEVTCPVDPSTGRAQIDPETAKQSQEALKDAPKDQVVDFAVIGQGMGAAAAASTRQQAEGTHGTIISEGQDLWTRMGEMPFGQNLDQVETAGLAIAYGDLGRMSVDAQGQAIPQAPGGVGGMEQMLDPETGKPRPEFRYGSSAELALASAATLAESGVGMVEGKLVKTEIRPGDATDWPEGATSRMLIRREIPVEGSNPPSVKVQEQWVYSKGSNDVVAGAGEPRRFGPEFFADSNPAAAEAAVQSPTADPKLKEILRGGEEGRGRFAGRREARARRGAEGARAPHAGHARRPERRERPPVRRRHRARAVGRAAARAAAVVPRPEDRRARPPREHRRERHHGSIGRRVGGVGRLRARQARRPGRLAGARGDAARHGRPAPQLRRRHRSQERPRHQHQRSAGQALQRARRHAEGLRHQHRQAARDGAPARIGRGRRGGDPGPARHRRGRRRGQGLLRGPAPGRVRRGRGGPEAPATDGRPHGVEDRQDERGDGHLEGAPRRPGHAAGAEAPPRERAPADQHPGLDGRLARRRRAAAQLGHRRQQQHPHDQGRRRPHPAARREHGPHVSLRRLVRRHGARHHRHGSGHDVDEGDAAGQAAGSPEPGVARRRAVRLADQGRGVPLPRRRGGDADARQPERGGEGLHGLPQPAVDWPWRHQQPGRPRRHGQRRRRPHRRRPDRGHGAQVGRRKHRRGQAGQRRRRPVTGAGRRDRAAGARPRRARLRAADRRREVVAAGVDRPDPRPGDQAGHAAGRPRPRRRADQGAPAERLVPGRSATQGDRRGRRGDGDPAQASQGRREPDRRAGERPVVESATSTWSPRSGRRSRSTSRSDRRALSGSSGPRRPPSRPRCRRPTASPGRPWCRRRR